MHREHCSKKRRYGDDVDGYSSSSSSSSSNSSRMKNRSSKKKHKKTKKKDDKKRIDRHEKDVKVKKHKKHRSSSRNKMSSSPLKSTPQDLELAAERILAARHSHKTEAKSSRLVISNLYSTAGDDDTAPTAALRRGPMTPAEYEVSRTKTRRELDPDTGRMRLVRGSGEIVEEIVSQGRQRQINEQATQGDGLSFLRGQYQRRYH